MPSAQDYRTIGHLYEAIRTNLTALERDLGGGGLFLGDAAGQVGRSVIDLEGVVPITDLAAAQRAIDIIVEQGEGSSAGREDSHYQRFLTVQRELEEAVRAQPGFAPAWPVADSPVLRQPPEPEGKTFVDQPEAAMLLDLACAIYGLLLRCLVQCFGRAGDDPERSQIVLMSAAIELMHALGAAATALARLPASSAGDGANAGMTFTMLRGVEPLPSQVERHVLLERAAALVGTRCELTERGRGALMMAADHLGRLL